MKVSTLGTITAAAVFLAACSVTIPMGSVSENGMITRGEINGGLGGATYTFEVVGMGITCTGESSSSGVSTATCDDGTVTSFTFPADKYGQLNGWYYSAEGNGAGPTVSGWGNNANEQFLRSQLEQCLNGTDPECL